MGMAYEFRITRSGDGACFELGEGALEDGIVLVSLLEKRFNAWVKAGCPGGDDNIVSAWEGGDIDAYPVGGQGPSFLLEPEDGEPLAWWTWDHLPTSLLS